MTIIEGNSMAGAAAAAAGTGTGAAAEGKAQKASSGSLKSNNKNEWTVWNNFPKVCLVMSIDSKQKRVAQTPGSPVSFGRSAQSDFEFNHYLKGQGDRVVEVYATKIRSEPGPKSVGSHVGLQFTNGVLAQAPQAPKAPKAPKELQPTTANSVQGSKTVLSTVDSAWNKWLEPKGHNDSI